MPAEGLQDFQKKCRSSGLESGINGMLSGDYLTTKGADAAEDLEMLAEMDLKNSTCKV